MVYRRFRVTLAVVPHARFIGGSAGGVGEPPSSTGSRPPRPVSAVAAKAAGVDHQSRSAVKKPPTRPKPLFATHFPSDDDKPATVKDEVRAAVTGANQRFMGRIDTMNKSYTSMFAKADARDDKRKEKRRVERYSMLTFREVDDSLDRVILSRDMFLWVKTIFRGVDYVIDQFLERELRYYPINANGELEAQPKLFRGLPYVTKENLAKPFPNLAGISRMDYIAPLSVACKNPKLQPNAEKTDAAASGTAAAVNPTGTARGPKIEPDPVPLDEQEPAFPLDSYRKKKEQEALDLKAKQQEEADAAAAAAAGGSTPPSAKPVPYFPPRSSKNIYNGEAHKYDTPKEPKTVLNQTSFKRPTVVVLSQMANEKYNAEAAWFRTFSEYLAQQEKEGTPQCADIIRIRTIDQSSVQTMRRIVVKRYAEFLPAEERASAFVGRQLVRKFTADFDLRNFMTTYCILVDHKGRVRWMTAGKPADDDEKKHFFNALNTLEVEHYRAGGSALIL